MSDINSCVFSGRLGGDPEVKYGPSGGAITRFQLACNWKTKEKEGVNWIPCKVFGKLAEVVAEHLRKSSEVTVEGRFISEPYEKDGKKLTFYYVAVSTMKFHGGQKNDGSDRPAANNGGGGSYGRSDQNKSGSSDPMFDDDIPF